MRRRIIIASLLCIGATACTSTPSETVAQSQAQCKTAGFEPGTEAFNGCVTDRQNRALPRNRTALGPTGNIIVLE